MNQHVLIWEMSFSNQYIFMEVAIMLNSKCDIEDMSRLHCFNPKRIIFIGFSLCEAVHIFA